MDTPPSTPRELTYHLADHEVLLSFNGDSDAELFQEWWDERGLDLFRRAVQERS